MIKDKITSIIFADLTPIRWTMGWVAIILAVSFFIATIDTTNYGLLNMVAHQYVWSLLFLVHGISLIYSALCELNYYINKLINIIGVWIWSYIFLSFTVYSAQPITAAEFLLIIPIIMEIWMILEWKK